MKEYECKSCKGYGTVEDVEEVLLKCESCDGTGVDFLTLHNAMEKAVEKYGAIKEPKT